MPEFDVSVRPGFLIRYPNLTTHLHFHKLLEQKTELMYCQVQKPTVSSRANTV
jgi:hypothetical protein